MKSSNPVTRRDITGVILAGGRGSRLGGADKGLVTLHGRPLIEYVIDTLRPQVNGLMISANRNLDVYASYGFPVVADERGSFEGPLAGILSAMKIAVTPYVVTVPCDTPRFPSHLVEGLIAAMVAATSEVAVVSCQGRMQPVFALIHTRLQNDLQDSLVAGERAVEQWLRRHRPAIADFTGQADAFENINTHEQLQRFAGASLHRV